MLTLVSVTIFEQCNAYNHTASVWLSINRVVKGILVNRDLPVLFPVKCEMGNFFLVKRALSNAREP